MKSQDLKKDQDKNIELPDPRDLASRFRDIQKRIFKFKMDCTSSSHIKSLRLDYKKFTYKHIQSKIIQALQLKIGHCISDSIYGDVLFLLQITEFESAKQYRFINIFDEDYQIGNLALGLDNYMNDTLPLQEFLQSIQYLNISPYNHDVIALQNQSFNNAYVQQLFRQKYIEMSYEKKKKQIKNRSFFSQEISLQFKQKTINRFFLFEKYSYQPINTVMYGLSCKFHDLFQSLQSKKLSENHGQIIFYTGQTQIQTHIHMPQMPEKFRVYRQSEQSEELKYIQQSTSANSQNYQYQNYSRNVYQQVQQSINLPQIQQSQFNQNQLVQMQQNYMMPLQGQAQQSSMPNVPNFQSLIIPQTSTQNLISQDNKLFGYQQIQRNIVILAILQEQKQESQPVLQLTDDEKRILKEITILKESNDPRKNLKIQHLFKNNPALLQKLQNRQTKQ